MPIQNEVEDWHQKDSSENRETRIVPTNGFPESTYITGIGNRIMFISQQEAPENMAMLIEHELLQQAVRAMFELIWSTGSFLSNS